MFGDPDSLLSGVRQEKPSCVVRRQDTMMAGVVSRVFALRGVALTAAPVGN